MKPLDPCGPLEAVHTDGRVVPVELGRVGYGGIVCICANDAVRTMTGMLVASFMPDGTHCSGEWTLRNRVQS